LSGWGNSGTTNGVFPGMYVVWANGLNNNYTIHNSGASIIQHGQQVAPSSYTQCQAGQKVTETGYSCEPCREGFASSSQNAITCLACDPGKFASADATLCLDCAPGKGSNEEASLECASCQPGTFSPGGEACSACPVGTYASLTSSSMCQNCPGEGEATHKKTCRAVGHYGGCAEQSKLWLQRRNAARRQWQMCCLWRGLAVPWHERGLHRGRVCLRWKFVHFLV
jgi:hypothetical protein